MRAWSKIFTVVIVLIAVVFITANLVMYYLTTPENAKPYRVEINRTALQIEQNGFENIDLSQFSYIYNIEKYSENFFNSNSDYAIREINGVLYRFDYFAKKRSDKIIVVTNITLAVMSLIILVILFYVRVKILRPFEYLINVPYELSKGNLSPPIKENKNRFFGKFIWGIDLLRENIEHQKQRELELQKEKKTLLLSLSHDIKTPLSAIKLYSTALIRNLYLDEDKRRSTAAKINEKADEIEEYVSRIITASRQEFLSLDVENSEFYLSDLIEIISLYYSEKSALIKTGFTIGEYKNCLIFGDLNRSVEVLQNIIENALKYGDGKRVEILFPNEDDGVLITVRNGGCTLNGADLPHIFESFWRGANSGNINGSGLGLYICRQLMHKMNGEIFAEINGDFINVTAVFSRV